MMQKIRYQSFSFFYGEQRSIFENALKKATIFEKSKSFVREQEIIDIVERINTVLNAKSPFGEIHKLPGLVKEFIDIYGDLLNKASEEIEPVVASDYKKVMDALDTKSFADVFRTKFAARFEELRGKLDSSDEIAGVKNIRLESDTLKLRCLDEIEEYERTHQLKAESEVVDTPPMDGELLKPVTSPEVPKKRKISLLAMLQARGQLRWRMSRMLTVS